jgi:prepilin-type N-terminal cleavage/methylation domain-containing protein/prepilin-type processing-associated H-X9-DG protein
MQTKPLRSPVALRVCSHPGFTLVELMIVVAIIAILIAIILPVSGEIRTQSRIMSCQANERQLYMACMGFVKDHRGMLPVNSIVEDGPSDPDVGRVCVWAMDREGVANFSVGALWKYIDQASRPIAIWCPADQAEMSVVSGRPPKPDRNMSYSFNAIIYVKRGAPRVAMNHRDITLPSEKIMIYEELAPNDAWCVNPGTNNDDRPSGRHGRVGSLQYGTPEYNASGRANFLFFDGHAELLTIEQLAANPAYYSPLK